MINGNTTSKKTIGSVIKAVEIMDLLASFEDELGATEISLKLDLNVSGTYHILNTLKECKMIEQNPKTKKYRLGLKLWKIGKIASQQNQLALLTEPYLKELRNLTNETANLTILDYDEIVYIAQKESNRLVKMFTKIGAKAPLYCSGSGKVLLAYQPKEKQESLMRRMTFIKYTDKTIMDTKTLQQELEEIKGRGYAYDDEEREYGVTCIAGPIFDFDDEAIAAISISGPTSRFHPDNRDKWTRGILEITKKISSQLRQRE